MKKLAIAACLLATAAVAFGQGSVNMNNSTTSRFQTNGLAAGVGSGNTASLAGPYYFQVLTAPSGTVAPDTSLQALLSGPWSDTGLKGVAGNLGLETSGSQVANFWAAGVFQQYVLVGWSANIASDWAGLAAKLAGASLAGNQWSGGGLSTTNGLNGFLGATGMGLRQAGGVTTQGTLPVPLLFATAADAQGTPLNGATALWVVPVPEPTTMALVGLGAASLMIFRRRKA
jgi:hypothetical protein